ncbi:hypothetical protein [Kitasatospora sp. NPDC096204]|uniref:hypothetical protein n=1 Tax=Kitasatospora sp. NPDC096204 TaxID=3364094 RepID=UPI003823B6AD
MDARIGVADGDEPPKGQQVDQVRDRIPVPPVRKPPPTRAAPPVRHRGPSFRRAAGGAVRILLVLTGLAAVALGFSRFVDAYDASVAYRGAPACAALAGTPAEDCTSRETGRVTAKTIGSDDDSNSYEVTVSREAAPTATYIVTGGLYGSVRTGDTVDLTLWNGHVVEISHQGHRSPVTEAPWFTALELALLVGAGTSLTVFTLLHGHRDGWVATATGCLFLSFFTFIGCGFLTTVQWPFAPTLALPIVGWLVLTAVITAVCWEY